MTVDRCQRCGGGEHWLISDMREHALSAYVAAALGASGLTVSARLCRGCSAFSWYAHSDLPAAPVEQQACVGCGSARRMRGRIDGAARPLWLPLGYHDGATAGRVACDACSDCGLVDWRLHELAWLAAPPAAPVERHGCARCGQRPRWRLTPLAETDDRLPAIVLTGESFGHLELQLCPGCGLCAWRARAVHDLFTDGVRVRLSPGRPRAALAAGGPYR